MHIKCVGHNLLANDFESYETGLSWAKGEIVKKQNKIYVFK